MVLYQMVTEQSLSFDLFQAFDQIEGSRKQIFFSLQDRFTFMRVQYVLSYHLMYNLSTMTNNSYRRLQKMIFAENVCRKKSQKEQCFYRVSLEFGSWSDKITIVQSNIFQCSLRPAENQKISQIQMLNQVKEKLRALKLKPKSMILPKVPRICYSSQMCKGLKSFLKNHFYPHAFSRDVFVNFIMLFRDGGRSINLGMYKGYYRVF